MSDDSPHRCRQLRIGVVANTSWYLYNFRRNLMVSLQRDGHHVTAVGGQDEYVDRLRGEGLQCIGVPFTGSGTSPLRELRTVRALRKALLGQSLDVVLTYTPKGTIYTALALIGSRVPTIANISGQGRAFVHGGWLARVVRGMYRFALRRASHVFFQNAEDQQVFVRDGLIDPDRARRVPGSGVDLQRFQPRSPHVPDGTLRVLMVARLLWSKGVREYVEAARLLQSSGTPWHFALLGGLDPSPHSGVPAAQLEQWVADGVIEYLGTTDDVRPHLAAADCVVLPSYREGMPRSLLEAAAMARPVITTDTPGCRDCVAHGINGLLCRPRDATDLARALRNFAALDDDARRRMGTAGRQKMELEFDESFVIEQYRQALVTHVTRLASRA